jgi:hypothetical protein
LLAISLLVATQPLLGKNVMFQSIEVSRPKLPIVFEPALCHFQGLGFESAMMIASDNLAPDQPGAFQHLQMLRNSIEGNAEWRGDFGYPRRAGRQLRQDSASRRIGHSAKDPVEVLSRIVNHPVEYRAECIHLSN